MLKGIYEPAQQKEQPLVYQTRKQKIYNLWNRKYTFSKYSGDGVKKVVSKNGPYMMNIFFMSKYKIMIGNPYCFEHPMCLRPTIGHEKSDNGFIQEKIFKKRFLEKGLLERCALAFEEVCLVRQGF